MWTKTRGQTQETWWTTALRQERVIRPRPDILSYPPEYLRERYRFSRESIIYLNSLLQPHISNITHRGFALTSVQTLCIALRFFATGTFLYNIGDAKQIGKATVCGAVRKVCLALKHFLHTFVVFPGHKSVNLIKEEFHRMAGFTSVIDCTHIPTAAPSVNEGDYVNRKSFHSINVQVICDADSLSLTNVEAKWPGSVHVSRIYRESTLCHKFEQGVCVLGGSRLPSIIGLPLFTERASSSAGVKVVVGDPHLFYGPQPSSD
ncbi:putative nuclease HARBI1 [Centroberyx affinis]|uniref:putative nuclease HARBI1 n=1 Tax=Centroberyx affinis TaxID=166261 RepID=UPI003A5BC702